MGHRSRVVNLIDCSTPLPHVIRKDFYFGLHKICRRNLQINCIEVALGFRHIFLEKTFRKIMDSNNQYSAVQSRFTIHSQDKWPIYRRLQKLGISCSCVAYQPLTVEVDRPIEAIQVWSVTQQIMQPRSQQVRRLQTCWQLQASQRSD